MDAESLAPAAKLSPQSRAKKTFSSEDSFFQLVRLLHAELSDQRKGAVNPVGRDHYPENELIRFRSVRSLSFPASEIEDIRRPKQGKGPWEVAVNFMGLTGPSAVLPDHYSELVIEQHKQRNSALKDFLDIFNHRSVSFFYRAWVKYRPTVNIEESAGSGYFSDPISSAIHSLMGINPEHMKSVRGLDARELIFYAGHFAGKSRNASGLSSLLSDFMNIPVEVKQLSGEWIEMDSDDRVQLPDIFGRSRNNILGEDFVIGEKVFCVENSFELLVGPVTRKAAAKIRPGSAKMQQFCALVDLYCGFSYQYDVRYVLKGGIRTAWRLGDEKSGLNIGWNCWFPSTGRTVETDEITVPYSVIRQNDQGMN